MSKNNEELTYKEGSHAEKQLNTHHDAILSLIYPKRIQRTKVLL